MDFSHKYDGVVAQNDYIEILKTVVQIIVINGGSFVAQWIRPRTFSREIPGSSLLAAAVVPLGKTSYNLVALSLGKDLKPLVPRLLASKAAFFLDDQVK